MSGNSYDGFFIGWGKKLPRQLGGFLIVVSLFVGGLFAGAAFSFVVSQNDPGDGAFRFDLGRQKLVGVLQAKPYPVIHIAAGEAYPDGHSIMLAGQGKRGVADEAEALDGQMVEVQGVLLKRGDLDMLQIAGKIKPSTEGEAAEVPVRQLGKWQLSGEVCDGKCYAGAMRPGTGIGHKACANLCLVGGVPAVFVIRGAVEGSSFFMLADAEGKALGDRIYDLTAVLLSARGSIEMRGNLPIFKIDLDSVEIQ